MTKVLFFLLFIFQISALEIDLVAPDATYLKEISQTLQEKNIDIRLTDLKNEHDRKELSYVVFWQKPAHFDKKILKRFPKKKLLLFLWEPPTILKGPYHKSFHDYFKRVYTWDDDLVDNKKYFKFYYPALRPLEKELPTFEKRKLATQISCNKTSSHPHQLYDARKSVIEFFEDKQGFDFYGHGWEKTNYKNYHGTPKEKLDVLKNYRFSFCYENMHHVKGYVTEKIFDCFTVGTVPIYWGADNITDYVPKNCFIDRRDFKNDAEVYDFIKKIDKETYLSYLHNIEEFLKSDKAKLFSQEMFNVIFLEAIRFP